MDSGSEKNYLSRIEELENRLAEAEQLIEAIKQGEVDAFAFNRNDKPEIFTLHSGDYAYRMLIENFSEGALNMSEEGLIVYTNTAFHRILGLKYEHVIGKSILDFVHPESKTAFKEIFKKAKKGEGKGEVNLFVGNNIFPVLVSLTSLYPTLPTVSMIVSDLRDIKKHEQTLLQKKELEISKKKIEENALANAVLAAIIQSSEDAIISKTLEGIVTSWNSGAQKLFGYRADEMIGQSITKLIPEERLFEETEIIGKIRLGEIVEPFQTRRVTKSGELIYVFLTISPIKNSEGKIIGASKIARDITREKIAEDKLRESERKYRELSATLETKVEKRTSELRRQKEFIETIVNTTPDLVAAYDMEMRIISFNKACEDFFRISRDEVFGKVFTDVFPAAKGGQGEKDLQRALRGETIHNMRYQSPITGKFYKNFISPLYDESGKVYAAIAIAHDITDVVEFTEKIKQSEEKFNKLFSSSPLGLTLTENPSGRIIDVNDVFCETIEYSREECIGNTGFELGLISGDKQQAIIDELIKFGFVKNAELEVRTGSGRLIPILNSIETISIGDKKYFLSAIIDITDRKKAEKEIERKNADLEKMNKELESFTYISSHDLQEPLRKIQTFAGRILDKESGNLTETGKNYFNRMRESATRMQALLKDLLAFSRINTSERKFEVVNLRKIVDAVIADYKETIEEKKATIEIGELHDVRIIPFQVQQMFSNLISNSLKFSRSDVALKITISCDRINAQQSPLRGRPAFRITFSDNGIGFEPRYSEKVFEVFQKLHSIEEYPGTGIGLAIVKKIVEHHQGHISATSEPSKGVRFEIYFPE